MDNWNYKYSKEELTSAWTECLTLSAILRRFNLRVSGGSIRILKRAMAEAGLSLEEFQSRPKAKISRGKIPLEDILVQNSTYSTSNLRERLLKEGVFESKCSAPFCPVPNPSIDPFTGEPIPLKLSLDHINGNNRDNRLKNLRLLCMHCHAETDTWCGKGKVRRTSTGGFPVVRSCHCGKKIHNTSSRCVRCSNVLKNKQKISYPSPQEIIEGVLSMGYLGYARTLGISDNGLRKHMRTRGIELPV